MNAVSEFQVGEYYTNDQIRFSLELGNLGGIRPSIDSRKTLRHVAIMTTAADSEKTLAENPYQDRIEGDVLLFTAQGRKGDQILAGMNRRLLEQYSNPVPFYGFIGEGRQYYRFLGLLELIHHYQETQTDSRKNLRNVWLFELLIHRQPEIVPITQASIISASLISESRRKNPLYDLDREVVSLPSEEEASNSVLTSYQPESLLSSMLVIPPYKFEFLIKELMQRSGFSSVSVTPATGDGGIDINAYVDESNDFFAGTHVQAQVKRWRHAIGSVEINKFRGALSTTAKGVFITTSHYTKAAISEAGHESKPSVTLIDGTKLSSMIIKTELDIEQML